MRENKFIDQNKDKWVKFERLLNLEKKDADNLSDLFIQITDDLSYAKTFYNNRYIRVYLNNLCQQLFYSIYKTRKKGHTTGILKFWKEDLPLISYQCRGELLTSLIIFILSMSIGVVSAVNDPDFVKVILGDSYVEMTYENIESGDPMAVYKKMNEVDMFLGITFNNVLVAFKTFILGVVFAIGAVIIMIYNGIMVGAFQYFFIEQDLFLESFLTIWLHGTLEISSIIIAGAAGIVLGKGLIAPGTYSRLQSFQLSAKRGVKLLMGIIPILVTAAIIESFLTRYTEAPDILRLALILASLAFMVFYFIWYPRKIAQKVDIERVTSEEMQQTPDFKINYDGVIKSGSEIMKDIFLYYRKYGNRIIRLNFITSIIYLPIVLFLISSVLVLGEFDYANWYFTKMMSFVDYGQQPILFIINAALLAAYSLFLLGPLIQESDVNQKPPKTKGLIYQFFNAFMVLMSMNIPLFISGGFGRFLFFMLAPIGAMWLFITIKEQINFISGLKRTTTVMKSNYGRGYGIYFLIVLVGMIGYTFLNSPFPLFYIEFATWNLPVSGENLSMALVIFNSFVSFFTFLIILPIFLIGFALTYFSFKEINDASGLRSSLTSFGL